MHRYTRYDEREWRGEAGVQRVGAGSCGASRAGVRMYSQVEVRVRVLSTNQREEKLDRVSRNEEKRK